MQETVKKPARDGEAARRRILDAAEEAFAALGLTGARVDTIAARIGVNVRMIYYYFGSKEGLYREVLQRAYRQMREREQELALDGFEPLAAIQRLTEFTFEYQQAHPTFVRLVTIENIHHAEHLRSFQTIREMNASVIETIARILERGKAEGIIRADAEPIGVHLLITAFCFFRVANHHTLRTVFPVDPLSRSLSVAHKRMLVEAVLGFLRPDGARHELKDPFTPIQ